VDEVELARLRRDYSAAGLDEVRLPDDPLTLWRAWLADAQAAQLDEANAMVVSTVDADGTPSSRLVLCKAADERGLVFFTNYASRKGRALDAEPRVSLLFPWHCLGRQVRVEGSAERTSYDESAAYFATRPRGAQLSAVASAQSEPLVSRQALLDRIVELDKQYADADVPCPGHWGGVRVRHETVEFWQGRVDRMHDRLVYRRRAQGWRVERLSP
jgi:pyridoxamine 5'-phosphate oxidase